MTKLHFQQLGSSKKHLVLIHGLFGSLENLNMVAKPLSEHFKVTSLDVRNHGQSFHENDMDYSNLAQDVVDTLDSLGIEKSHVLGHSMGGKIAMQLATHYPEKIDKLIVADISPVAYPSHHQQIIAGLQSIDLGSINKRADADKQLAAFVDNIGVRQFLLRNLNFSGESPAFKCNLDFIANCYPQIMKGLDGDVSFSGETLFIKGGNSDYITKEHQPVIVKYFPQSKAKIIQGAGHWLHAEKTVAFNKIVNDFLSN